MFLPGKDYAQYRTQLTLRSAGGAALRIRRSWGLLTHPPLRRFTTKYRARRTAGGVVLQTMFGLGNDEIGESTSQDLSGFVASVNNPNVSRSF